MIKDNDNDRLCTLFTALLWRPSTAMSHLCSQNLPLCFLALNFLYLFAPICTYLHLFAQVCTVVGTSSFSVLNDVPANLLSHRECNFLYTNIYMYMCIYVQRNTNVLFYTNICMFREMRVSLRYMNIRERYALTTSLKKGQPSDMQCLLLKRLKCI